ncbi:MAG TPA: SRPBCC domain-containing protein, partial [Candidatus Angelobacter sp.]|nr:SRPBCC domain-containing protein [Candidatus Angelobacter sp.]
MIDPSKIIRKEAITTATLEEAWKAWTTVEVTSFFVPKAIIEPVVGGRYELFSSLKAPKGFQGTEGCKVLAIEPLKHLAFEFIAPPQFPNVRRLHTRVDVTFGQVAIGGVVKLDLVHSGFLEGE